MQGPRLWRHSAQTSRMLAVDHTGFRVALTDSRQVTIWDGDRGQIEQLLPWSGQVVRSASFSPNGRLLALHEHQSDLRKYLARLRIVDLEEGRNFSRLALPCGCLVDYTFSPDGQALHTVVSSDAYGGTWVLSWSIEGEVLGGFAITGDVLGPKDSIQLFAQAGRQQLLLFRSSEQGKAQATVWDIATAQMVYDWQIQTRVLAPSCGPMVLPCSQIATIDPQHHHLVVATGVQGGMLRVTAWPLGAATPVWTLQRDDFIPLAWDRRPDGSWLLVGHAERAESNRGWGLAPLDVKRGVLGGASRSWNALPATPLLRFRDSWLNIHHAALFREAFHLPTFSADTLRTLEQMAWYANGTRAATHPDSGDRLFASLDGTWVWPRHGRPQFLTGLNVANSVALLPGSRAHQGRTDPVSEVRILRSSGTAVEQSAYTVRGGWSFGTLSRPVTRWEPLRGFVREVVSLGGDRLLTLTRSGERLMELDLLEAPE
ncbi:MAG: WD40 repeat domain-containing protein, partial [Myxococcota bacterium]